MIKALQLLTSVELLIVIEVVQVLNKNQYRTVFYVKLQPLHILLVVVQAYVVLMKQVVEEQQVLHKFVQVDILVLEVDEYYCKDDFYNHTVDVDVTLPLCALLELLRLDESTCLSRVEKCV